MEMAAFENTGKETGKNTTNQTDTQRIARNYKLFTQMVKIDQEKEAALCEQNTLEQPQSGVQKEQVSSLKRKGNKQNGRQHLKTSTSKSRKKEKKNGKEKTAITSEVRPFGIGLPVLLGDEH